MTSYIEKTISLIEKIRAIYLIIIGFIVIIPFFIISFYTHPSADDYEYSARAIDLGFFGAQKFWYSSWSGRYFEHAALSLNPLVFNWFFGYSLIPIMLIVLFFVALQLFVKELSLNAFGAKERLSITFFLISTYLLYIPSTRDAFYWYAGSMTYMLPAILMILFIALLLRYFFRESVSKRDKIIYSVFLVLLQMAIIGSNEIAMLFFDLFIGVLFIWYIVHQKKLSIILLILLIVSIGASFIVIASPGNIVRINAATQESLDSAVLGDIFISGLFSIDFGLKGLLSWAINPYTLVGTIFFIPAGVKLSDKLKHRTNPFLIHPIVAIAIFLIIWFLSFFPAFYSLGRKPPDRTLNMLYVFLMIGWFYLIQVGIFHFKIKLNIRACELPNYVYFILGLFMLLILVNPNNNVRTAYGDLLRGRAKEYSRELSRRYKKISNCSANEICEVEKIASRPKTILGKDITADETHWKNIHMNHYFRKKGIRLYNEKTP